MQDIAGIRIEIQVAAKAIRKWEDRMEKIEKEMAELDYERLREQKGSEGFGRFMEFKMNEIQKAISLQLPIIERVKMALEALQSKVGIVEGGD